MNVLITGSTGYIGHQLALELALKGYQVHALVRNLKSEAIPKHKNIQLFEGDICDLKSVLCAMKNCQMVFHTAAYTNLKCNKIDSFYSVNVDGTKNMLEAALQHKISRFIYTSTLSVYGPSYKNVSITESQPRLASYMNDYELTKSMSEDVVSSYEQKGLPCVILNVSRVYGPGLKTYSNGVNKLILSMIKNDFLFVPSRLNSIANYVFIKDVVNAHISAMDNGISGEKYIIGGENLSYSKLFNIIKHITKSRIKIVKIHFSFLKACFSIINGCKRILGQPLSMTSNVLDSLFTNRRSSSEKAISSLNYTVTSIESGLIQTINYLIQKS
ncbi:MAG: NAD-dependent epimerase/dehydratase family protein [Flavobacteriaceae bacterium]|nr:NAD-dependent epimerase/dehydratase family protein [Flavobacteriaceae bacterium]